MVSNLISQCSVVTFFTGDDISTVAMYMLWLPYKLQIHIQVSKPEYKIIYTMQMTK